MILEQSSFETKTAQIKGRGLKCVFDGQIKLYRALPFRANVSGGVGLRVIERSDRILDLGREADAMDPIAFLKPANG